MRHIASIEVHDQPGIDSILIWDDGSRLLAYAYDEGRITRTTPLEATDSSNAVKEASAVFGVGQRRWEQGEQAVRWR